jgi:hypothetical protein
LRVYSCDSASTSRTPAIGAAARGGAVEIPSAPCPSAASGLDYEDNLAAVFNVGGIALRISTVADFSPHEHTILGFCVPDVPSTVRALREKGVIFNIYRHFPQDELGILTVPGGTVSVAWFKDPDGNVLSVTNA